MNLKLKSKMLPFYFGSIGEDDRIQIERELLTDPEVLLDYLDLKRTIEMADAVPQRPSLMLWKNLQGKMKNKKTLILSLSMGAAAAVLLIVSVLIFNKSRNTTETAIVPSQEILFDSMSEPNGSSGVL